MESDIIIIIYLYFFFFLRHWLVTRYQNVRKQVSKRSLSKYIVVLVKRKIYSKPEQKLAL